MRFLMFSFVDMAYNTRYNSLNCDPSTEDGQLSLELNVCYLNDDDYSNPDSYSGQNGCIKSTTDFPLPAGEWVIDGEYVSSTCTDIASYSTYMNNVCYDNTHFDGVLNVTLYESYIYTYPNYTFFYESSTCTGTNKYHIVESACTADTNTNDDINYAYGTYFAATQSEGYTLYTSSGLNDDDNTDDDSNNVTGLAAAGITIGVLCAVGLIGGTLFNHYFASKAAAAAATAGNSAVTSALH